MESSIPHPPQFTAPPVGLPPASDPRMKILEATMRRHGYQPHALIEALHTAQERFGFLEEPILRHIARALKIPFSKVYGVATFYNFFSFKPSGVHAAVVCLGTACYIKGAPDIIHTIENKYHVKSGETTADGQLSLTTARCLGSCGLAPAAILDGEVVGRLTPDKMSEHILRCTRHDA